MTIHALNCPFCGQTPDVNDPDFCYPVNRKRNTYRAGCTDPSCDVQMYADTAKQAIENWNTRSNVNVSQLIDCPELEDSIDEMATAIDNALQDENYHPVYTRLAWKFLEEAVFQLKDSECNAVKALYNLDDDSELAKAFSVGSAVAVPAPQVDPQETK